MPIISGSAARFTGGTVANATEFDGQVTMSPAAQPALTINGGTADSQSFALRIKTAEGTSAFRAEPGNLILNPQGTPTFTALEIGLRDDHSMDSGEYAIRVDNGTDVFIVTEKGGVVVTPTASAVGITTKGIANNIITAGALPTQAFVSGTAAQVSTTRDVFLAIPFTGDATNNAATLKIELSPDNVTFSILDTLSIAAALNLTGALNVPVTVVVPAAFYVKLTAVHGTIGTTTYY